MRCVDATLLVSLSGAGPRTLHRCAELAEQLDARGVALSMLFTPSAEDGSPRVAEWMRQRVRQGDAVLLHGYDHRIRAEFASLPAHEARLRLIAAGAALDRAGLRASAFAPPRWRVSRGTLEALRNHGFRVCADLSTVRDLTTGEVARARVQGFGSQHQRTETVRCFALVLSAARAARRGGLVRLGVDARDLRRPGRRQAFLDAVDVALENGAASRTYVTALPARLAAAP
ncbi:DUF2334 domain-containing protein [Prauserella flavalba]|uniref:DUF2334 domain-containing protein n=1 Tax=Prauserella flavalba TaxID=1477506 RepID=A0A318LUN1_9PSEU|nr:DUF2334 domain-containing protein [Prauserella flavalba]PXY38322.1 DUF2334 domain-containing protein [Prauserella flavalba]